MMFIIVVVDDGDDTKLLPISKVKFVLFNDATGTH